MTRSRFDCTCSMIISLTIATVVNADLQDFMNLQHRRAHLPDTKFGNSEYSEYPENEEREHGPEALWDRIPHRNIQPPIFDHPVTDNTNDVSDALDPNIVWDARWTTDVSIGQLSAGAQDPKGNVTIFSRRDILYDVRMVPSEGKYIVWHAGWTADLSIGQLSAVAQDPKGNVAIFSRRDRVWGLGSFDERTNKFDQSYGPIKQDPVVLFDKHGRKILQWGRNLFYMPHGLTIDHEGNYWLTDVALHQVFKFDAKDIEKNWDRLKSAEKEPDIALINLEDRQARFNRSIVKPSMILGEAFEPGDDSHRFCKPTAVAVEKSGDFFVSDGYCNSRVIKFNKKGIRILHWGRAWTAADSASNKSPPSYAMFVPHALALAEDKNLIYVADREDGRVMCYNAKNGTFHREYKHPVIGTKVYSVAYAREKIYLINGLEVWTSKKFHIRGFVIDVNSGEVVSQFAPGGSDMLAPHDIAVSEDGSEIYVVELNGGKVYRFLQGRKNSTSVVNGTSRPHHELVPLTDDSTTDAPAGPAGTGPLVLSILISAMILIGLCLALAAVVARCQKRGCLLSVRKRAYWEAERRETFKLSSLLESRQGKSFKILEKRPNTRDFSKLNTEPETSEDERAEDSLVI